MADIVTLKDLPSSFGEHFLPYKCALRQRIQGRRFANESYIQNIKLFREIGGHISVRAGIFHSQKKNESPHTVNITVDDSTVTDAHCTCKAGVSGECAHVLAIVIKLTDWILEGLKEIPSQPACTSRPQQWDRPRGTKIMPEPVATMVLSRPDNMNRKKRPITAVFIDNRNIQLVDRDIEVLSMMENTPLGYLAHIPVGNVNTDQGAQHIASNLAHQIPCIQPSQEPAAGGTSCGNLDFPIVPDIDNLEILDDYKNLFESVQISLQEALTLEKNTRDQANNLLWHEERKKRITASNFGRVMLRKAAVTQKFIESITCQKPFKSNSTSYGIANEKVAINMYRKKTKNHVHECGLIINPTFPFIGATPDGKVCDKGESGILEVKCPYSVRDFSLDQVIDNEIQRKDFFLENVGGNITLKRNHPYWFQVQGQLLITGASFCDFVTFTRKDLHIMRVEPDKGTMEDILSKLCNVCCKFILKKS